MSLGNVGSSVECVVETELLIKNESHYLMLWLIHCQLNGVNNQSLGYSIKVNGFYIDKIYNKHI